MANNEVRVKITGDSSDALNALDEVKESAKGGSGIFESLASAGKLAGAALATGFAAAGAAAISFGQQALSAFATYEQLQGGAQLMYGDAYDFVAEKAKNAYATVQMSQNEYLQQVNGFAVGLRESLGGNEQAAAELADRIITAEADIVAATGNSAENVQNAFNGVMRGNYSMLDNLGLGITATKSGMQEVIDKVNEYNAAQGNATNYSIDNIADVQTALVEYAEMQGMAGYAANEAAKTLEGSTAAMAASWSNLLVAVADDTADLDGAIEAFATSAENWLTNMVERINIIVPRMFEALPKVIPQLVNIVSSIGATILQGLAGLVPVLLDMGAQMAAGIAEGFGQIAEFLPGFVASVAETLITNAPAFYEQAVAFFGQMYRAFVDLSLQILEGLGTLVSDALAFLVEMAPTMGENVVAFLQTAINALLEFVPYWLETWLTFLTDAINYVTSNAPMLLEAAAGFIGGVLTAFVNAAPGILGNIVSTVGEIISTVWSHVPAMFSAAAELIAQIPSAIWSAAGTIWSAIVDSVSNAVNGIWSIDFWSVGSGIISGIVSGVWSGAGALWDAVVGAAQNAFWGALDFLGIASPSKLFRDKVGRFIPLGMAAGVDEESPVVQESIEDMFSFDLSPLSREAYTSDASTLVAGFASAMGSAATQGNSGSTIEIPLVIGVEEIARAVYSGTDALMERGVIEPSFA